MEGEKMKIVLLDAHAMNPGDLSWDEIRKFGELILYDKTNKEDILTRIGDADVVLTNKTVLDKQIIQRFENVQYIGVMASGYNVVDTDAAKEKGIVVTNVPNYSTPTVAQHVFALLLEAYVRVGEHNSLIKNNKWATSQDFCFYKPPFNELYQKTIGIVGFGNIGKAVARIAVAFEMNLLIYDRGKIEDHELGKKVSLEELLSKSDVVTLHLPLKEDTHHIINEQHLKLLKPSATLVNTARAQLVNKQDLLNALNNNVLSLYVSDVFDSEPPKMDDPLIMHPKSIITGHMAWASKEARKRCIQIISDNIKGFKTHTIINQVN